LSNNNQIKTSAKKYELTQEQKNIVETIYNDDKIVKVSAFAGTGKTSVITDTIKEIRKNDKDAKILYLVFNRAMVQDSKSKFDALELDVYTATINAFALRRFSTVGKRDIEVMPNLDYSDYIKIKAKKNKYKYAKYKNILDMFQEYCLTFDNMAKFCDNMINGNKKDKYGLENNFIRSYEVEFFEELYKYFLDNNKYLHGMYLKEYACNSNDLIKYDYIFLDEAQDTSMIALPILKRMRAKKLYIVGDFYQAIYGFNRCINAFEKFEGKTYPLSTSFRFNNEICKLANEVLDSRYKDFKTGSIQNSHNITEIENIKEKTILFRRNATMFEYAVNLIKQTDNIKVKFMDIVGGGNTGGFDETFADMLYFYDKLLESIPSKSDELLEFRHKFDIKYSKNVNSYVKIAEKEGCGLYAYLCRAKSVLSLDMVRFFNFFLLNEKELVHILEKVRNSEECENPDKTYVLITAHASKGREWSHVKIAEDVWTLNSDEECNLLYVATTRAKHSLDARVVKQLLEDKYAYTK